MFLWHILRVKPFAGLSVLLCLATILACFLLARRRSEQGRERFLIGVVGLLAALQGVRILHGAGLLSISVGSNVMDDATELSLTAFYLLAAMMLRLSSNKQLEEESAIRLANAAPPRLPRMEPLRDFSLDAISWAMPRVSDGAFKLYAFLCLRAGYSNGYVAVSVNDVRLQLGKTKEELEEYLGELQKAGAVRINDDSATLSIELLAQSRRCSAPIVDEIPRTTVTLPA